jgi:hypothetical protein
MKMAPTAAIEVVLCLLPFRLKTEAEVQAGIEHTGPGALNNGTQDPHCTRHVSKSQNMMKEPILQVGNDKIILRYAFYKSFTVKLPDKNEQE